MRIYVEVLEDENIAWIREEDGIGEEYPVKTREELADAFRRFMDGIKFSE